jgi:hypothetical protein
VITVNGKESDYAIMKQVQQLRLMDPDMAVVTLDASTDFSKLAANETLYLVSHGDEGSGSLRGIDRAVLLGWLKQQARGVPLKFGGIVLQSCYSGLQPTSEPSLAKYLAEGLAGQAAPGTTVEGANGYTYGTPEFRKTRRSSVLPRKLWAFNSPGGAPTQMIRDWLNHKPTHAAGVLKDKLNITVDEGKTISDNLATLRLPQKTPEEVATEYLADFTKQAKAIEAELVSIIGKIPGNSVAQRAEHLVSHAADQDVSKWNTAIEKQYALYGDFYLWAPAADAFTTATI